MMDKCQDSDRALCRANEDLFPAVACLRRSQTTAGNVSALAGYAHVGVCK